MAAIERFEKIDAWEKARLLTKKIYAFTGNGSFSNDYGLKDQIRKASVSIMSNIAEGFERGGNKEFLQFLAIAKGSSAEVKAQLYVAHDAGHVTNQEFTELFEFAEDTDRLIGGFMRYLKESNLKGHKYKKG